jgi:hypothetical protein
MASFFYLSQMLSFGEEVAAVIAKNNLFMAILFRKETET